MSNTIFQMYEKITAEILDILKEKDAWRMFSLYQHNGCGILHKYLNIHIELFSSLKDIVISGDINKSKDTVIELDDRGRKKVYRKSMDLYNELHEKEKRTRNEKVISDTLDKIDQYKNGYG